MAFLKMSDRHSKILRYLLVGFSAYAAEIAVIFLLHNVLGRSNAFSVALSFWVGFIWAFIAQKLFTFQSTNTTKKHLAKQVVLYSGLVLVNYVFSIFMVYVLQDYLNVIIIRTITIGIIVCWNFVIYNKIIFKKHEDGPEI